MRLDVSDPAAGGGCGRLECLDLLGDVASDGRRVDLERAASEAVAIAIGHVRADRSARSDGSRADGPHRLCIAGMETARDVDTRHEQDQRRVIGEPLPHVGVQIDDHDLGER